MMMAVIMTQILGEYTAFLKRATDRFLPRHSTSFGALRNLHFITSTRSSSSSSSSDSFLVYF
ncbi:hypothetical protein HN51_050595 [Arachis hypogaea]|uniref:Uncharacterized protein n=1 Tax=Arachis hypogaea TaxID=3818 RepID=A0A444YAI0_ARAHY|nr:hypothetical protein Ahy_B07g086801 [Arachis hypogaea]